MTHTLTRPLAQLGAAVLSALASIGRVALYAIETVSHLFRPPFYGRIAPIILPGKAGP